MIPQSVRIPGWPYYITIEGHVYRDGSKKPLKPILKRDGYCVNLSDGKRRKTIRLNNLMRDLYFGGVNLPMKHLNGCKTDFSYWNLKPMKRSEIPTAERQHGWSAKAVIETLPDGTEIIYPSAAACGRARYISAEVIRAWCNGRKQNRINENKYRWEELENGRLSKG